MISSDSEDESNEVQTNSNSLRSKKKRYEQKYVASWEKEFKNWLEKQKNGMAYCKFCQITLGSKKSTLNDHAKSKKHRLKCHLIDKKNTSQLKLDDPKLKSKNLMRLKAEAWASLYVAEHTSIRSIDHFTEGCNTIFSDSKAAGMQLRRSKCTAVIKNVLAPFFREQLKKDIGEMPYSLIFDETTDIETSKVLSVVVRYVDIQLKKVVCTFLGMLEINDGCAETLAEGVNELTRVVGLDCKKCIGLGTDNASANVGIYTGAHVRLEGLFQRPLFLNRCVCHSIQLAVSKASESLSLKLEYIIKQTYLWFHLSTARQKKYADVYRELMLGNEKTKKPLKIKRWAPT